jgi:hypothetical protein
MEHAEQPLQQYRSWVWKLIMDAEDNDRLLGGKLGA